jgi:glycosyltransferase involved in cell wall biosynthesis
MKTSVALCTYNGEKYLRQQLESILNQTISIDEIIICDDRSSDNTINILYEYQKKHQEIIKIHQNETNLKCVKNFEKAIKLCSGDIIFLSDQDDIWIENKVETLLEIFQKENSINCIATGGICIDEKDSFISGFSIWDVLIHLKEQNLPYDYLDLLLFSGNFATGATMAFRKKISDDFLPIPIVENFFHDEWIALIMALNNEFYFLTEKLIKYRIHENQQVGSVLLNSQLKKKRIINVFSQNYNQLNFNDLKSLIKKAIIFHNSKLNYINDDEDKQKIEKLIYEKIEFLQNIMSKKYFIRYNILKIYDQLNGKRKLN